MCIRDRARAFKKADFPAPLGPITANKEPESICRETSVTATVLPYRTSSSWVTMEGFWVIIKFKNTFNNEEKCMNTAIMRIILILEDIDVS